jgi:PmbA protein
MNDEFITRLFKKAHARGLANCQAYLVSGIELYASSSDSEVTSEVSALCFEAAAGEKTASAYTENFSEEAASFLVDVCLENASILDSGNCRKIFQGGEPYPKLDLFDSKAGEPASIRALAQQMQAEIAAGGEKAQNSSGYIQSTARTIRVVNDLGLDVSAQQSYTFSVFDPICLCDGQMKTGQYFCGGSGPAHIDVHRQVCNALAQVSAYSGADQLDTGRYDAVVQNEAASNFLQSMAIFFCKDLADAGKSRFQNKLGAAVAAPQVTLIDDPHRAGGLLSMPFDAQGVPTRRRTLIENGVLRDLFCDLNTAEPQNGLLPGSCTRSRYNLPAEISATNFYFQPAQTPVADLLARLGSGLFITEVADYFPGHGINLASGNFSLPAKGFRVKNGQLSSPFENVTVSGNLYEFLQNVVSVGNDLAFGLPVSFIPGMPFRTGAYGSPSLLVKDFMVAGK